MSTLPYNAADTAGGNQQAAVVPLAVADLDAAIRHFVATADALGAPRPSTDELDIWVRHVAEITRQLFPCKLLVETGVDPEIREDVSLLIRVEATCTVEEIVALDNAWHRRIGSVAPQWPGLFCLWIDARG